LPFILLLKIQTDLKIPDKSARYELHFSQGKNQLYYNFKKSISIIMARRVAQKVRGGKGLKHGEEIIPRL